ncbi:hypothetical protein SAMN04488570_3131 [Nocardioides scoriae]|uniref:Uncharacterized protein n=1 Tax=Nocardioides scoriae TaxID=642780 RepID=A0A1H1WDZ8_9ACTN|nr:hypothetical protein [Nocardioides scoriae]SDS95517.1 hypothetical protein SAMN04488570_3131 [Nocardioides scoriae]
MSRRTLIWHIGLPQAARLVLPANLDHHADALAAAGLPVVADAEEAAHATHELLRTHRDADLRRRDVEGRWARICDRVWAHRGVSLLSTPDLGVADKDQLRLALDPLIGIEVHLVVSLDTFSSQLYGAWLAELRAGRTTSWQKYAARVLDHATGGERSHRQAEAFWAGHELASLLARWGWTFHADRLHVVVDPDPAVQWEAFLDVARATPQLRAALPAHVPAYADPAGVAVLRTVNRQLEAPLARATSDLLAAPVRPGTAADPERAMMPTVATSALAPLVARWRTGLAAAGHDVRGDLSALLDDADPTPLPGPRDQLGVTVDALGEALADNSALRLRVAELEADNDRLDRKRRKWKRAARATA